MFSTTFYKPISHLHQSNAFPIEPTLLVTVPIAPPIAAVAFNVRTSGVVITPRSSAAPTRNVVPAMPCTVEPPISIDEHIPQGLGFLGGSGGGGGLGGTDGIDDPDEPCGPQLPE